MQNKSYSKNSSYQGSHNGSSSNNSNSQTSTRLSPPEYDAAIKHMKDRFVYALANSLGCKITVTTTNNHKITGILQSISDVNDTIPSIVLKYPTQPNHEFNDEFLMIEDSNIQMISCENIDLTPKSVTSTSSSISTPNSTTTTTTTTTPSTNKTGFKTDAAISNRTFKERNLEAWKPDKDIPEMVSLEDSRNDNGTWDQFAVNKEKFKIEAEFNEDEYTVKLDTTNPQYKERMKFAEKMAKDIESQSANGNLHLAEERGAIVDAEDIDEEDKYSGVLRENAKSEKKLMNMLKADTPVSSSVSSKVSIPSTSSSSYVSPNQRSVKKESSFVSTATSTIGNQPVTSSTTQSTSTNLSNVSTQTSTSNSTSNSTPTPTPTPSVSSIKLPEKPTTAPQSKEMKKSSSESVSPTVKKIVPNKQTDSSSTKEQTSNLSPTSFTAVPVQSAISTTGGGNSQKVRSQQPPPSSSSSLLSSSEQQQQQQQQPITNVQMKQKSPQLPKHNFNTHGLDQSHPQPYQQQHHQHHQQHQQHHHQQHQHQQHAQNMQQSPQFQQQILSHQQPIMRTPQLNYIPRNNYVNQQQYQQQMNYRNNNYHPNNNNNMNNQFNQNHNNNNNQRKKSSSQFVLSHGPCEKSVTGLILKDKFNILLSAKSEYKSKNTENKSIIPMLPAFYTDPNWPSTSDETYVSIFMKENKTHIQIQQPVFMQHPQSYPIHVNQGYIGGYQIQPTPYYYQVPQYSVYTPPLPFVGNMQSMDKGYPKYG